jgi:hypothetical protein
MRVEHLVPYEPWEAVAPWLPRERLMPKGRRPRMPDRTTLMGIVYVARLGVRCDRHSATLLALLHLACSLICVRYLRPAAASKSGGPGRSPATGTV